MKRFFFSAFALAIALFLVQPLSPVRVGADAQESRYAVAAAEGVWFYASPDEAGGLFLLPKSYYVKIIEAGELFSKAEYGDGAQVPRISGYVKNGSVTPVSFTPERPFLDKKVTLTYTLSDAFEGEFDALEKTFSYLGSTFRGTARYWYVYAEGKFGYVGADSEPIFELNVDYLTADVPPETPPSEPEAASLSGVQIALVCIAVVAALAVSVFVFFARKSPRTVQDEGDEFGL